MKLYLFINFFSPFPNLVFSHKEEEWEKELEAELQDYEVVAESLPPDGFKNEFWEKDIEAMLDEGDLK